MLEHDTSVMLQHVAPEVGCSSAIFHLHLAGLANGFSSVTFIFLVVPSELDSKWRFQIARLG